MTTPTAPLVFIVEDDPSVYVAARPAGMLETPLALAGSGRGRLGE